MRHQPYTVVCTNNPRKERIGFRRSARWVFSKRRRCPMCGDHCADTKGNTTKGHNVRPYTGGLALRKWFGTSFPYLLGGAR